MDELIVYGRQYTRMTSPQEPREWMKVDENQDQGVNFPHLKEPSQERVEAGEDLERLQQQVMMIEDIDDLYGKLI